MSDILHVGIVTDHTRSSDYLITEERVEGYSVLGSYATYEDAKRDLKEILKRARYAHLN